MIDLKPYGAFVENTVRPLVEELHELSKKAGFKITDKTIEKMLHSFIKYKIIESVTQVVCLAILGALVYAVIRYTK